MKKLFIKQLVLLLLVLISVFFCSCVDSTQYPEFGKYICDSPYIELNILENGSEWGYVEFEGKKLDTDFNLKFTDFTVITESYEADRYYNSRWELDTDGNIIITLRESKEKFILIRQHTKEADTQPSTGSLQ